MNRHSGRQCWLVLLGGFALGCGSSTSVGLPEELGDSAAEEPSELAIQVSDDGSWALRGFDIEPTMEARLRLVFDNSEGSTTSRVEMVSFRIGFFEGPNCRPDCGLVEVGPGAMKIETYEGYVFGVDAPARDPMCEEATGSDQASVEITLTIDDQAISTNMNVPLYCMYCEEGEDCIYVPEPPPGL